MASVEQPLVLPGSIDLGPDDLIARAVDGDVWWYPGALGGQPGERILLIDRADPRLPTDYEPPSIIDQVAGTFRGSLVYSDCCEPSSGDLYSIAEPGAETDLWSSPTLLSDRARQWGVGHDPEFEADGPRLLAYSFAEVLLTDLANGTRHPSRHSMALTCSSVA